MYKETFFYYWIFIDFCIGIDCISYYLFEFYKSVFLVVFLPLLSQPFIGSVASFAKYLMKSSTSLPPSYLRGAFLEFFGTKKSVGNLEKKI